MADGSEAGERNSLHAKDENVAKLMEATKIRSRPAKIQEVKRLLRGHREFNKYFEPIVASLGPIHHGESNYNLGEKYKLRLAHEFVKHCADDGVISRQKINKIYQKIMENIRELRELFEEEVTKKYNDEDLAWMLLVDGCAILQYIEEDKFPKLNIKNDSVIFARQDLFLLENQVPYLLLELLMSLSEKKEKLEDSIKNFIENTAVPQNFSPQNIPVQPGGQRSRRRVTFLRWPAGLGRVVLLGCARWTASWGRATPPEPADPPDLEEPQGQEGTPVQNEPQVAAEERSHPSDFPKERQPTHLLDLLRRRLVGDENVGDEDVDDEESNAAVGEGEDSNAAVADGEDSNAAVGDEDVDDEDVGDEDVDDEKSNTHWKPFRNVQQLKAAGIRVRPCWSEYLAEIAFTRRRCYLGGDLWLPQFKVDDSTGPIFMNLIAYEMCPDFNNYFRINSYIFFLRSLISDANDVKLLREANVLQNFLGSDEEVAKLFNEIDTVLVPYFEPYQYVRCDIQDYYENNWLVHIAKWITQLRQDYFSNPWSAIAFLAASLLLFLTATQTWFTVWPKN